MFGDIDIKTEIVNGTCPTCTCKTLLILSLLAFTSCVAVGPKCTYTQEGTKISSWIWIYGDKPVDLDKMNCN